MLEHAAVPISPLSKAIQTTGAICRRPRSRTGENCSKFWSVAVTSCRQLD